MHEFFIRLFVLWNVLELKRLPLERQVLEGRQWVGLWMLQRVFDGRRACLTAWEAPFLVKLHGFPLTEGSCVLSGGFLRHRESVRVFDVRSREHFLFVSCHSAVGLRGDWRLADVLVDTVLRRPRLRRLRLKACPYTILAEDDLLSLVRLRADQPVLLWQNLLWKF